MCSEFSWCINRSEFREDYIRALDKIEDEDDDEDRSLSQLNVIMLKRRFIPMVNKMEIESKRANVFFTFFQIITTLGSIVVPALLSIEEKSLIFNSTDIQLQQQTHNLFWIVWSISITVTLSNAFSQLFSLERKFIMRNIHVSQMRKEGWSFLQKSGSVYGNYVNNKYDEFIHIFWNRIESLRHDQVVNDLPFDRFNDENIRGYDPEEILRYVPYNGEDLNERFRGQPTRRQSSPPPTPSPAPTSSPPPTPRPSPPPPPTPPPPSTPEPMLFASSPEPSPSPEPQRRSRAASRAIPRPRPRPLSRTVSPLDDTFRNSRYENTIIPNYQNQDMV